MLRPLFPLCRIVHQLMPALAVALVAGSTAAPVETHAADAPAAPAKPAELTRRGPSEETLQELLKRYPKADANNDGRLTADEARAYREKIQAAQGAKRAQDQQPRAKPTAANVSYGPHERNVLDFYKAESDKPTPLIVYIHGGGFVGGDKSSINPIILKHALESGVSCAALHYRFIDGDQVLLPMPQQDTARAIQFLRSKAKEWNLDGRKFACYGGSAGAGCSMWIGFHDDLADPTATDPVLRESSRIAAVGTMGGQSTYDPIEIKRLIGGRAWEHPSIFKAYGLKSPEEAQNPTAEQKKLYDEAAAITHLTADDPPLYMVYSEADGPLPENARPGQGIHHPNFGRHLKEKMTSLGIENVMVYTPDEPTRNASQEMFEFFQKAFAAVDAKDAQPKKPAAAKAAPIAARDHVYGLAADLKPDRVITYKTAGDQELTMHVFEPKGKVPAGGRSCYVTIHGGGWTGGTPDRMYPFAKHFADLGMLGISLQYRLMPKGSTNTPFDCVRDGRSALRYLKTHAKELDINPDKIAVSGGSAGGHVCLATALFPGVDDPADDLTIDPTPAALVPLFPVIDTSPEGYGTAKCGPDWKQISPLHHVRTGLPPTLIFFGTADTVTPFIGAEKYLAACKKVGTPCELVIDDGGIHGYLMKDAKKYDDTMARTEQFFRTLKLLE
ncbi:MAG: alpha/beta hydrolase [Pirellulales bacterium]